MFMPRMPLQAPLLETPRMVITSVPAALTMTPVVRDARIPANVPVPSMVIDLVIVIAPKPPGSSTEISPQAAVFEIAPAKVLQGAVRLHGFASSPTPETQVRVACALAGAVPSIAASIPPNSALDIASFFIFFAPLTLLKILRRTPVRGPPVEKPSSETGLQN